MKKEVDQLGLIVEEVHFIIELANLDLRQFI